MDNIGRYRIERLLGSGAFAQVWLGRDDSLDMPVAIKVLAENLASDPEVTRRFVDEARLLARLASDRFVRVITVGELESGQPYFVMEHAAGGTLADRMRQRLGGGGQYSVAEATTIALDLADAVTVAHRLGVVHRDIKPSNVLFCDVPVHAQEHGRAQRLVLGDLGLARELMAASPMTIAAGTPHYMAPEQADGQAGTTSDVYAMGVVLYELLAGAVPHPFDSIGQVLRAKAQQAPALRATRWDVPEPLERLVGKALSPDPAQRQRDGGEFAAELRQAVTGAPPAPLVAAAPVDDPFDPNATMTRMGPAATSGAAAIPPPPGATSAAAGAPGVAASGGSLPPPPPPTPPAGGAPTGGMPPEPPTGHRPSRGKSRKRVLVGVTVVLALIAGVATAAIVTSGGGDGPSLGEIFLEPASANGQDPFTASIIPTGFELPDLDGLPFASIPGSGGITVPDLTIPDLTVPDLTIPDLTVPDLGGSGDGSVAVSSVAGGTPGLYGGSQIDTVCDVKQLVDFLSTNADKAAAWARVQGIDVDDIESYIDDLTPLLLSHDSRVTNHGFKNGKASALQSVLQAGTAVLVDKLGVPRARCKCGNPLLPPKPVQAAPTFVNTPWAGFDPKAIVVVLAAASPIDVFEVVDVVTGDIFEQSAGDGGSGQVTTTTTTVPDTTVPETTVPPTEPPTTVPVTEPPVTAPPVPTVVTQEGTVSASTEYSGEFPASLAVDGDPTTSWFSAGPGPDGTTTYTWMAPGEELFIDINVQSNREHPQFSEGFGFGHVTFEILNADGSTKYGYDFDLEGSPDPDLGLHPNVFGYGVRMIFSGHEDPTCGGFAELQIVAGR